MASSSFLQQKLPSFFELRAFAEDFAQRPLSLLHLLGLLTVVLLLRRVPAILALKPWKKSVRAWSEALYTDRSDLPAGAFFRLPNLLPPALLKGTNTSWPCTTPTHPLKDIMTVESLDWVKSLNVMSEKKLAKFAKYEIMTLVAWAYRRASPEHFRLCSDFMHLFWIIDDRTDDLPSVEVEREVADIKRALADPDTISPNPGLLEGVCQPSVLPLHCDACSDIQ